MIHNRKEVEKAFSDIDFPINNNQLATSMLLVSCIEDHPKLLCQMGAGKGKSRIAAAVALHFLKTSRKEVYIVFPDEGLKRRDEK